MSEEPFKKPVLIGKVGKLPKKIVNKQIPTISNENTEDTPSTTDDPIPEELPIPEEPRKTPSTEFSYKEPEWGGVPDPEDYYSLEVLKSGQIVDRISLSEKSFVVIGRLDNCDVTMAHPTISRYHAVLQFRSTESEDNPRGFYIYDLSSTHGTFLNKRRLKPRVFIKTYVGHMIKLGCSTRSYLLTGPEHDIEKESELSVTELKQKALEDRLKFEQQKEEFFRKLEEDKEATKKKIEEKGIDWGIGEDAEEESDLSENPFARTNNEELYLDDPKKALRGFFEREGLDLEYDCSEQGPGQFLCKILLPLDDERGRGIYAEVVHKGKKKEAVVQCALEACRILDRHGLLRQATHESKKRKARNWEENDFYDSDDDTFLDRTGSVEKKRENRMKSKVSQEPETYQSLVEKESKIKSEIEMIEKKLISSNKSKKHKNDLSDGDSLDSFMKELKHSNDLDKEKIKKLKIDQQKLKSELENVRKLMGIAKPTPLPELLNEKTKKSLKSKLPIFGKRLKVKVNVPIRTQNESNSNQTQEEEDDEEIEPPSVISPNVTEADSKKLEHIPSKPSSNNFIKDWNKIETSFNRTFPLMPHNHEHYVSQIWKNLKRLHPEYDDEMKSDLTKTFEEYVSISAPIIGSRFANEIDFVASGIKLARSGEDVSKIAFKILDLSREITHKANEIDRSKEEGSSDEEKDAKKYEKDEDFGDNYSMWVPPENQSGDGRTSLNDKFGY